jgi:hypothetical protein
LLRGNPWLPRNCSLHRRRTRDRDLARQLSAVGVLVEPATNLVVAPLSVTRIPGTAMYFGTADLTSLLPAGKNHPGPRHGLPLGFPVDLLARTFSSDLGNAEHH